MRTSYLNSLICLLLIMTPVSGFAMKPMHQGDVIITMRDGLPCFSYPQDKEIKKRPYLFAILSISKRGPIGKDGWVAQISDPDRKGLLDPNSPETCVRYGGPHPGIEDYYEPAKPLLMDTPYEVHIGVSTMSGYERNYSTNFCLTRDDKGNVIIVAANTVSESKVTTWKCLKPGEKPKLSFWERLFGN